MHDVGSRELERRVVCGLNFLLVPYTEQRQIQPSHETGGGLGLGEWLDMLGIPLGEYVTIEFLSCDNLMKLGTSYLQTR